MSKKKIDEIIGQSKLIKKYNDTIDRESAYEMLSEKIKEFREAEKQQLLKKEVAEVEASRDG